MIQIIYFYSSFNIDSISTKIIINSFVEKNQNKYNITLREINHTFESRVFKEFGVKGVPVTLFLIESKVVEKYFGSLTEEELKSIIEQINTLSNDGKIDSKSNFQSIN